MEVSGAGPGEDQKDQMEGSEALLMTVLTTLLHEPDPLARWRAVTELGSRLEWLRAVTVRQLLLREVTQKKTGELLGVTRGRINQLVTKAPVDVGAFAWGRALAVAGSLAALAERPGGHRFVGDFTRIVEFGLRTPSAWSDLEDAAPTWMAAARRQGRAEDAEALMRRLAELLAAATELPDELTAEQRGEVILGYHHERTVNPTD